MSYYQFYFRRLIKDKKTLIPFLIFGLVGLLFFLLNYNEKSKNDYIARTNQEVSGKENTLQGYYKVFEQDKKEKFLTDEDHIEGQEAIRLTITDIKTLKKSLDLAKNNEWQKALNLKVESIIATQKISEQVENLGEEPKLNLRRELLFFQKLAALNLEPDARLLESQGFNLILAIMKNLFPIFYSLILCFFLAYVFTTQYHKKIDKEILYPENSVTLLFKRGILAFLFSTVSYLLILVVLFMIVALVNQPGSSQYPLVTEYEGELFPRTVGSIMIDSLPLQVVGIGFIVSAVNLISQLVKNIVTTLLVSILSVTGLLLVTLNFEPFYGLLHLLPTTYLSSVTVVTKELVKDTNNHSIDYSSGFFVLFVWMISLIVLSILVTLKRERKQIWRNVGNK